MSTPPPIQSTPHTGSLGLGIGLAWVCLIGGYTVSSAIAGAMMQLAPQDIRNTLVIFAVLLPWLLMISLIVWMVGRGQTRTAAGIGVGIASIFGVALLLVAACFGLFSMK
jgi:hypothetical protein